MHWKKKKKVQHIKTIQTKHIHVVSSLFRLFCRCGPCWQLRRHSPGLEEPEDRRNVMKHAFRSAKHLGKICTLWAQHLQVFYGGYMWHLSLVVCPDSGGIPWPQMVGHLVLWFAVVVIGLGHWVMPCSGGHNRVKSSCPNLVGKCPQVCW